MLSEREEERLKTVIRQELSGEITRNALINWIVEKQNKRPSFCSSMTVKELIQVVEQTGIRVRNYINKEKVIADAIPRETASKEIIKELTKEALEHFYLVQGISPGKIADMYNLTASQVKYMLSKENMLKPKFVRNSKPSKGKVEKVYSKCSISQTCKSLGVSITTLYKLLDEYKITKKNKIRRVS